MAIDRKKIYESMDKDLKEAADVISRLTVGVSKRTLETEWRIGQKVAEVMESRSSDHVQASISKLAKYLGQPKQYLSRRCSWAKMFTLNEVKQLSEGNFGISVSHWLTLSECKDKEQAQKLAKMVEEHRWSCRQLEKYMEAEGIERRNPKRKGGGRRHVISENKLEALQQLVDHFNKFKRLVNTFVDDLDTWLKTVSKPDISKRLISLVNENCELMEGFSQEFNGVAVEWRLIAKDLQYRLDKASKSDDVIEVKKAGKLIAEVPP